MLSEGSFSGGGGSYNPEETSARIFNRYEHDRKKARLLLVYPALHGLPLDGSDPTIGTVARVELPLATLKPKLEQLAAALGISYTHGRGDPATVWSLIESSVIVSVAMDDYPDAREFFEGKLRLALEEGRRLYPLGPPSARLGRAVPGGLSPEQEDAAAQIVAQRQAARAAAKAAAVEERRRARAVARAAAKTAAPKRAPGRPPKSDGVKAAEATIRAEFARRRFEFKEKVAESLRAFEDAEAKALRLARQGAPAADA